MIRRLLLIAFVGVSIGAFVVAPVAGAITLSPVCNQGANCNVVNHESLSSGTTVKTVIGQLLLLAAAIAVIIVIYGGIRYIISQGDASHVAAAKNTILYAVIGLLVSLFAYAIVQFVVKAL